MTTAEQIGTFLHPNNHDWSEPDKWVIKWQYRLLGDFETALAECITRADDHNLDLLARGFPVQVHGFLMWNRGNLGDRLREAGLDI